MPKLCLVAFAAAVLFPKLEGTPSYLGLCLIGMMFHIAVLASFFFQKNTIHTVAY